MNVYIDGSVALRIVLHEPDPLATWGGIDRAISSDLLRLECLRTIDRARIRLGLSDKAVASQRAAVLDLVQDIELVGLNQMILERAAEPFPTLLGTLDAIHLATAILLRGAVSDLAFATHDAELGLAARAVGFAVDGLAA